MESIREFIANRKHPNLFVAGSVFGLLLIFGLGWILFSSNAEYDEQVAGANSIMPYNDEKTGLSFEYPGVLKPSTSDLDEGTLVQLSGNYNDAPVQVTIRYEEGPSIAKAAAFSNVPARDLIVDNIKRQLPKIYPGFELEDEKFVDINGFNGAELLFTYDGNGASVKQRLILVMKDSDTAIYVSAQAPVDDFSSINQDLFKVIHDSIGFN